MGAAVVVIDNDKEESKVQEEEEEQKKYEDFTDMCNVNDEHTCSICLMKYEKGDICISSKACAHKFHKECLLHWLQKSWNNISCPICRQDMINDFELISIAKQQQQQQQQQEDELLQNNNISSQHCCCFVFNRRRRFINNERITSESNNNNEVGND